ncbi:MAG: response regulator transcription factor [Fimbriimonadaceae bacterium]
MGRWSKPRSKSVDLTPREQDVALLVSDGFSNRQIADRLSISEQWVANVLRAVSQKLGTSNRTELALRVRSRYR